MFSWVKNACQEGKGVDCTRLLEIVRSANKILPPVCFHPLGRKNRGNKATEAITLILIVFLVATLLPRFFEMATDTQLHRYIKICVAIVATSLITKATLEPAWLLAVALLPLLPQKLGSRVVRFMSLWAETPLSWQA
ncbi:hypothetical protein RO22_07560 [Halomonas sp. KHS3]|nr:hypothetical protein RO22_07560 [Halomonas sp. KHS3]